MKKSVTVSIPVYNGERFIVEALNSIVNQSIKVDCISICDNQSSDKTVKLVNQFIKEHKEWNIRLFVNDDNIGFQNNFIKCYDVAKTDYLVILHVDDLLKKDTIEKQLDFFNKYPKFAVVGGGIDKINENGELINSIHNKRDLFFKTGQILEFIEATSSYIPFSSVMYNLELCKDVEFLGEESAGPDELYWPVLLLKHPIAVLSDILIDNRVFEGQMHISNSVNRFDNYLKYFQDKIDRSKLEKDDIKRKKTEKIIKKQVSMISIRIGQEIFSYNENSKVALKYFLYGIKKNKKVIFSKFFLKSILRSLKFKI